MSEVGQLIIAEVRRIAAEHPDYVYQTIGSVYQTIGSDKCYYMVNGQPSCIMGRALFNLGFLPAADHIPVENLNISMVLRNLNITVDPEESSWLDTVQACQDGRIFIAPIHGNLPLFFDGLRRLCWGDAVKHADGTLIT